MHIPQHVRSLRPNVTLDNCDAVYDFYEAYDADLRRARFAHRAISTVFRPRVSYVQNDSRDDIANHLSSGGRVILASKHANAYDPMHLVALTMVDDVFSPLLGQTVIPSKKPLFDLRIRHWIDDLGAIPTYRRKDYVGTTTDAGADGTHEARANEQLVHCTERLISTCASLMIRGKHLAIFPESQRSEKVEGADPAVVNPLKDGIARMYLGAIDSVDIAIIPLGLFYDDHKSAMSVRRPTMVVGRPLTYPRGGVTRDGLMSDLAVHLGEAQILAAKRHRSSS